MIELFTQMWTNLTWWNVLLGLGMLVITSTISLALVSFVLVKLPATYFHTSHSREFWTDRHWTIRWSGLVLKNFVGLVLIILGIIMSLPGVPGQGILTILLGLIMLDIPGKRPFESRLVKRRKVLEAINHLRARFDKPPLILD